ACPGRIFVLRKLGKPDLRRGEGGAFRQCRWISWAFDAATSVVNDDHLSSSLVRLHDAVSFTDFIEAEDPGRLDVQPTRSGVGCDLLKRNVREREAWGSEDETAKKREIDAARHLEQRIEVGDRIETAQPARKTRATAAA